MQVHLPQFMTKGMMYRMMVENFQKQGFAEEDMVSESHFYVLWNNHFKSTTIPKVNSALLSFIHTYHIPLHFRGVKL
jgi:hypothetical protein